MLSEYVCITFERLFRGEVAVFSCDLWLWTDERIYI